MELTRQTVFLIFGGSTKSSLFRNAQAGLVLNLFIIVVHQTLRALCDRWDCHLR